MLCGRDRELQTVARLLGDARAGRSGVLAVVGEAGIGKTALLAYAEERASGMQVLRARGVRSEARIPFAGLLELLRPALGCLPAIPSPQAEALQGALALRPAHARDRFAVGAATLSLLAAYADTVRFWCSFDDGHWLDGSSADALLFAVRRLVADPVAVIVTVREGESSLLDGADLATLRLQGLDLPAATALLSGQLDAPVGHELAGRLHRETGGNPLALIELASDHALLDDSPPGTPLAVGTSVANAYLLRYRSLPSRARDILVLAAAVDRGDMSVLTRAASLLGQDVAALIPAEAAGLVTVRDAVSSSSGIRWPDRPSTAKPRLAGGARCTALWPARCPTPMSTAAPGTWHWPPSAPTPLPPPRLSRPACGHVSAAPMRSRPGPTNVAPDWRPTTPGRRGFCTRRLTRRGLAGLRTALWPCLRRPASGRQQRIWSCRSSTCAATSPPGADGSCRPRRSWWRRLSRPRQPTLTGLW